MKLSKDISQIVELYFFIHYHFSQDGDPPPNVPRFDITQVIYRSSKYLVLTNFLSHQFLTIGGISHLGMVKVEVFLGSNLNILRRRLNSSLFLDWILLGLDSALPSNNNIAYNHQFGDQ